jgi:hypothetical protein
MTQAPSIKEALEHARMFIENGVELGYIKMPDADTPDPAHETLGKIKAALATLQPSGERREAIARCNYIGPCGWKGDLASGLVQDEAGIRADEREKCAKIADREAEFWQDAESSSARIVAANIRSARDGGAET